MLVSRLSFRSRLALVLCVFNVVIALAASLLLGRQTVRIVQLEQARDMQVIAHLAGSRLDDRLADISARLAMLAALMAPPEADGSAAAIPPRCHCGLAWAALIGPDGRLRQTTNPVATAPVLITRQWFGAGQSGPSILPSTTDFAVFATPVGTPGPGASVLVAGLDAEGLSRTLSGFGADLSPERQVQLLLLRDGAVLAGPPALLRASLPDARLWRVPEAPAVAAAPAPLGRALTWLGDLIDGDAPGAVAGDFSGELASQPWPDGGSYVAGAATLAPASLGSATGWTVVARQSAIAAAAPAMRIQREIFVGAVVLALMFGLAGVLVADRLTAPLRRVVLRVADGIGGGGTELDRIERSLLTLRTRAEDAEDEARRDPLTGLLNRAGIQAALAARAAPRAGLVCFLDLDGFKRVNDELGHAVGDALLRVAAQRLNRCLRREEMVCRLGGDEFVFTVMNRGGSSDLSRRVPDRVLEVLARPYELEGSVVSVSASIGAAPWDGTEAGFAQALDDADSALRGAKQAGKAQVVWHGTPTGMVGVIG